jgi:hypothetical protein
LSKIISYPTVSICGLAWFAASLLILVRGGIVKNYSTDVYSLHYFESLTGLRFVLLTSRGSGDLSGVLRDIYLNVYVDTVIRNPLYVPGKSIQSQLFLSKLDSSIKALACFQDNESRK